MAEACIKEDIMGMASSVTRDTHIRTNQHQDKSLSGQIIDVDKN
jgi:hypothetical protein